MGGCCGTCRGSRPHVTPIFFYDPQDEELQSLTLHDGAAALTGNLVDSTLSESSLHTYRDPPMPMPFDAGRQVSGNSFHKANCAYRMELQTKSEVELPYIIGANVSTEEEEDVCHICFEEYKAENPKVTTKCKHNFHLSCNLEWMERSDTCPMCNQEMEYDV